MPPPPYPGLRLRATGDRRPKIAAAICQPPRTRTSQPPALPATPARMTAHPRPYEPCDLAACLALFDGNTPPFFAPEERAEFRAFLESLPADDRPYLVLTEAGEVIACGGLIAEPGTSRASFTWGMVARAWHGQRLGTRLVQARLELARRMPGITELALSTSQHTRGFYEGLGFTTTSITPNGFGPGLDRCDMVLSLAQGSSGCL